MGNVNGSVNPQVRSSSNTESASIQSVIDPSLLNSLEWRLIGPFRGGRIVAVAGDPVHSQVFYFGSTGGGVWKTTSGGDTWTEITRKLGLTQGMLGKISLAVSPVKENRVWAVIDAEDGAVFRSDDGLIHISQNGGKNWKNVTPVDLPEWALISIIEPSPHDPATAYVAANRYKWDDFQSYLYKTYDFGETIHSYND